jgi:DNA-binding GntR family transcriptional regulator
MKPLRAHTAEDKGLSNWVTISLREAILNGHFEPGEKLDQDQIAKELDVSRTPLREALKVLASEGFVEIRSYRGAYIPIVSQQDISDVYEIRWVIESEIVRQATPIIPATVLDYCEGLLHVYGNTTDHSSGDRQFYQADQEFHGTIATYSRNKLFKEILEKLNNRIVQVRTFALHKSVTHLDHSNQEHLNILHAMRAKDASEAARLMELHLRQSADRIMKYING